MMARLPAPDVFDPRVFARGVPHEEFRRLRDTDPVSWQPEPEVLGWPRPRLLGGDPLRGRPARAAHP